MATLKDVAERSGVSVTTVSRMLNNRGYISEKTRKKILKAMEELNYQPNEIARSLSLQKSKIIGLIVPSSSNFFFCKVIDAIERYAAKYGYKLLLCNSNLEIEKEKEYFNMLSANKVAGVILASRTSDIQSVCSDNYMGGVLAAEHLISKGCKKLAHISGSAYLKLDGNKRYLGFRDVCIREGVEHIKIDATEEQFISMRYENIINSLLDEHPDLDGIFTSNDILAAQVIQACYQRGIKVPEQMKVVGYDDTDLCAIYNPPITTIRQPVDDICHYAVEAIVLQESKKVVPKKVIFPVELIERGTT